MRRRIGGAEYGDLVIWLTNSEQTSSKQLCKAVRNVILGGAEASRMVDVYQLLAGETFKADRSQVYLAQLLRGLQYTQWILQQPLDRGFADRADMIEFYFSQSSPIPGKYKMLGCLLNR